MNKRILKFALFYNILNLLFGIHMATLQDAGVFVYSIIYPVFWFIAFVVFYELCAREIQWFKSHFYLALILTVFCVPIFPILLIEWLILN